MSPLRRRPIRQPVSFSASLQERRTCKCAAVRNFSLRLCRVDSVPRDQHESDWARPGIGRANARADSGRPSDLCRRHVTCSYGDLVPDTGADSDATILSLANPKKCANPDCRAGNCHTGAQVVSCASAPRSRQCNCLYRCGCEYRSRMATCFGSRSERERVVPDYDFLHGARRQARRTGPLVKGNSLDGPFRLVE